MSEVRELRKRWVRRGRYAVQVDIEVVYPVGAAREECLEPKAVRWLDELARKAEEGDVEFLRKAGRVFQEVAI